MNDCDVTWDSPSADSSGSMPLGNGDIGLNAWVEPNGDLLFYLAKTDSFDENLRLLKLGRVRLRLTPAPYSSGQPFLQRLSLHDGSIRLALGPEESGAHLRLWVDANHPVVRVEVESDAPLHLEAELEIWRTQPRRLEGKELHSAYGLSGASQPVITTADRVLPGESGRITWYHRNEYSCFDLLMEQQSLADFPGAHDPITGRTFGGALCGPGLVRCGESALRSSTAARRHSVHIHLNTAQTATVEEWLHDLHAQMKATEAVPLPKAWDEHRAWWRAFWGRNYVHADGSEAARTVSRGYARQRFIAACAGRGAYPIKFNGSLFTVDGRDPNVLGDIEYDADYRQWGGHYWHQNTRLIYWAMLASGDYEMMKPFFDLYFNHLQLAKWRTRKYSGHDGALFPETMTILGTYAGDDYGWDRAGLKPGESPNINIRLHICGALETVAIMLEYFAHTVDADFAREVLLPFAAPVIEYYEEHYPREADGALRLEPSQALETWQDTVNPVPDVAGLQCCLDGLLALPDELSSASQRRHWEKLRAALPPLPVASLEERRRVLADKMSAAWRKLCPDETMPELPPAAGRRVLLPAQEVRGNSSNWENAELYAIFPFRRYQLGKPDLEIGRASYETRYELIPMPQWYAGQFGGTSTGWTQDDIHAALLGLPEEAARCVAERFSISHSHSRFPTFWGPNCDWIPDQDHGSVGLIAVQNMLLQAVDGKLYVLPAWPREWDVEFKLHAPGQTTVEGKWRGGQWEYLEITPRERAGDVVLL